MLIFLIELPTAIRRVVDSIADFARRKKTALNPEPMMAGGMSGGFASAKPAAAGSDVRFISLDIPYFNCLVRLADKDYHGGAR